MRIAVITDSFPKLSETFVLSQITGLLELGHDVQIFPTWHTEEMKVHPDVAKYELLARTHPIPPTPASKVKRLAAAVGIFLRGFAVSPVRTFRLLRLVLTDPSSFSLRILYFLSRFPGGFDVLHCHYGYNGLLAIKLRKLGVRGLIGTVFHGHDMYVDSLPAYKKLFSEGDLMLPISDRWRGKLVEMGCPAGKVMVHHMGVSPESFPFRPRTVSPGEQIRILIVARLVAIKGHEFLMKAFALLIRGRANISLIVAGGGPMRGELEKLADELGIAAHTSFLGDLDHDEVRKVIEEAHILVQPSITTPDSAQEGIPMVLMEAMAAGLPVIATRYSCIPELVSDGHSGFLVPERDFAAIADKLAYLVDTPQLWEAMGTAGHQIVERSFNVRSLNVVLQEIYAHRLGPDFRNPRHPH